MSVNQNVKGQDPEAKPVTSESAVVGGRNKYESALTRKSTGERKADLLEAIRLFQAAIRMDSETLDAYGWLSQSLRSLAAAVRTDDHERADYFLRCACAIAWEGNVRSSPTSVPVRTKQEVRTLVAWLRTTKHLSPEIAESEMEVLRALHLREVLDAEQFVERFG